MNTILTLVVTHLVVLFEVAGLVFVCVGLGLYFGAPAVFIALGVAALFKSFELDLAKARR